MKKLIHRIALRTRPLIPVGVGLVLALFSAALPYPTPPVMQGTFGARAAAFFLQSTSTPQPKDMSEIGSTDGIVLMGIFIALIIIVPILLQRKSWMEPR
jgi:hypothetical protein